MSVYVMAWVFRHSEATLSDRLVLLALADYAHDDGTNAFPTVDKLANKARVGKSTARAALRRLEDVGAIKQTGPMPWGAMSYAILMKGAPDPGAPQDRANARQDSSQGAPGSGAKPSDRTVKNPSTPPTARAREAMPHGFPVEMLPALNEVERLLVETQAVRGGVPVSRTSIAKTMMRRPRLRHVHVAEALEHWLLRGNGRTHRCGDVVARWRAWLDRETEELPANGAVNGSRRPGKQTEDLQLLAAIQRGEA